MSKRSRRLLVTLPLAALPLALLAAAPLARSGPTSHATTPATLGTVRSTADLEAVVDQPGPVTVESVVGADWEIDRAGLINLDHPTAKAAELKDGPEPIVVGFHAIRHPQHGLFLVDTGAERALRDDPEKAALHGFARKAMGAEKLRVRNDTATWLGAQRVAGVFLTHLHLDHLTGMRDVPNDALVFVGAGEVAEKGLMQRIVRPYVDAALEGKGPLQEWRFAPDPSGTFDGVIDVFGDASVWALHVPGHTPGSTAYLARTPDGPVLMVGDACHTQWGWDHGVEPGTFSQDQAQSARSLDRLRAFVAKHPKIDVRLGHQGFDRAPVQAMGAAQP